VATLYFPLAQISPSITADWASFPMTLVVRSSSQPAGVVSAVTGAVHEVDPEIPIVDVLTMEDLISNSLSQQHMTMLLLAAFAGLARLGNVPESGRAFARAVFGAAFVYAFMETLSDAIRLIHRMVGIEVSPIQDAPILARSLGEFWSERWNRPVSVWLRETAFLPLARLRYPTLGLVAAFCLSAGIHAYFYAVPLGGQAALMVAAFFVVQAVMIVAEKRLRVRAWPAPAARAWTLILLLACSPLFVEPILRGAGLR